MVIKIPTIATQGYIHLGDSMIFLAAIMFGKRKGAIAEGVGSAMTEGKLLRVGEAVIEITEVGKECFSDCPIIKKFNTLCAVNKQIFFGEILKAGIVKEKDSVILI